MNEHKVISGIAGPLFRVRFVSRSEADRTSIEGHVKIFKGSELD
jgi:hypothetical protein